MPKRKAKIGISLEYAVDQLLKWNPQWSRHSIEEMPAEQIYAIYFSERTKVMKSIYADLGLQY